MRVWQRRQNSSRVSVARALPAAKCQQASAQVAKRARPSSGSKSCPVAQHVTECVWEEEGPEREESKPGQRCSNRARHQAELCPAAQTHAVPRVPAPCPQARLSVHLRGCPRQKRFLPQEAAVVVGHATFHVSHRVRRATTPSAHNPRSRAPSQCECVWRVRSVEGDRSGRVRALHQPLPCTHTAFSKRKSATGDRVTSLAAVRRAREDPLLAHFFFSPWHAPACLLPWVMKGALGGE